MYQGKVDEAFRRTQSGAWPVALALLASLVCCSRANAQGASFAPTRTRVDAFVSVHELKIPPKALAEFQKGFKKLTGNDPNGSLRYFASAIAKWPGFYEAYYHQGVAESELGRNWEALKSFQKAVNLSQGHYPHAEFGCALILNRLGRMKEAEQVVRHGLETDENLADGHVVLALILMNRGQFDEAEKSAREALLLSTPGSSKGHLVLADIYGAKQEYDQQAQELKKYLQLFPHDPHKTFLQAALETAERMAGRKDVVMNTTERR